MGFLDSRLENWIGPEILFSFIFPQNMIRENVRLAQKFEAMVRSDPRFEIPAARLETEIIIIIFFPNFSSVQAYGNGCLPSKGRLLHDGISPQEVELQRKTSRCSVLHQGTIRHQVIIIVTNDCCDINTHHHYQVHCHQPEDNGSGEKVFPFSRKFYNFFSQKDHFVISFHKCCFKFKLLITL